MEFDEAYQVLTEIDERMSEWEEKSQKKEATEKETAEDMRRKAYISSTHTIPERNLSQPLKLLETSN